jgi:hypothetical protein
LRTASIEVIRDSTFQFLGDTTMGTKITDHYFEYENRKYFRENAHTLDLGSFGEKKDPIGPTGFLEEHAKVMSSILAPHVETDEPVSIDWAETSQADIGAGVNLKFFGVGVNAAQSIGYTNAKSAKLKLLPISIPEGKLIKMLNGDGGAKPAGTARKFLADEGADGRIVSQVWVLMEGELAEHFSSNASNSIEVKALGQSVNISASGGKMGTQTIELSAGSTFAYKLHKVQSWTDRSKTRVERVEADYKG